MSGLSRKLVVLDLNGVLVHRAYVGAGQQAHPVAEGASPASRVGAFDVTLRPNLIPFIDYLFRHFDVAIWSSATPENVRKTLFRVLGKRRCAKFVFIWSRNQCDAVPAPSFSAGTHGQQILLSKPFHRILDEYSQYTTDHIVIIDDSAQKYAGHPNVFVVPSWHPSVQSDVSLTPKGQIGKFLSGLRTFDGTVAQWISECENAGM